MIAKKSIGVLLAALVILAVSPNLRAGYPTKGEEAFSKLTSLVGEWEGTTSSGSKVKVTYTLVSNKTALMEKLEPADEAEMLTLYSLDGDRILVTHYCSAGNQPQMKTGAISEVSDRYAFSLTTVTGLKSPSEGYMVGLVLHLPDRDHLIQEWTYKDKGKTATDQFRYVRKQ